ncbi:SH3 and cysteine-rich domain-containing protein 3-like isoform X1 [Pollicipes pollicipes]|uniref:SH3 and cysteine-rich domain-containing protein 3-like isoform X1 n=1 Tax=Pollicipes pollicipes TaxID=41117 RepID=UPI0018852BA7|nr:SH3 and cysteine-rich domain-containing protein 3-like isoform X1 [Pollicipes pollicipes]
MKTKWLKAFKSLKSSGFNKDTGQDRRNGREGSRPPDGPTAASLPVGAHWFQEYTYKKITACDTCNQILRGHTRQGLKCRLCKMNVHVECQGSVPRCQPKSRLLRRQKSTSELETRYIEGAEDPTGAEATDPVYDLLKQAAAKRKESSLPPPTPIIRDNRSGLRVAISKRLSFRRALSHGQHDSDQGYLGLVRPADGASSKATSHGSSSDLQAPCPGGSYQPSRRQGSTPRTLNAPAPAPGRGCSSSSAPPDNGGGNPFDFSPRAVERLGPQGPDSKEKSPARDFFRSFSMRRRSAKQKASSAEAEPASYDPNAPSSPVHNRRLLSAKAMRMSSLDLPDENEKSQSSASTSPCPSPQKPHRLLPTSLYVVLYNFSSRHQDELDLKAGYKLTVIDTSDLDWWKGKCLGKVGFFPSKYITKLQPGERPLQVTHNLQVSDGQDGLRLLRDQIVIQIGEEVDGMIMIRDGENRQGACPLKYLTEV